MKRRKFLFEVAAASAGAGLCSCTPNASVKISECADIIEARKAIKKLRATSCENVNGERISALGELQKFADKCENHLYMAYRNGAREQAGEERISQLIADNVGILHFIDDSLDKILRELQDTKLAEGEVAFWLLYNMGFVVKTPDSCFAIDISHRHAEKLEPFLDFLLVTHSHWDHCSHFLMKAMLKSGKPVVSNFFESPHVTKEKFKNYKFGNVSVNATRVRHGGWKTINKNIPVTSFEINCGASAGNCVIFHSGDASEVEDLNPAQKVDILMAHFRNGLKVGELTSEKLKPQKAFILHMMELGHPIEKWRWTFQDGLDKWKEYSAIYPQTFMPIWGEKIQWKRS